MLENAEKCIETENYITRIRRISAREKYCKTEFLRLLISFYSENKSLLIPENTAMSGNTKQMHACTAEKDIDCIAMYEEYIALMDDDTASMICDEYKNGRS